MSNSYFRFKQFTVRHDLCAMKVGTDGVILGAWAGLEGTRSILDAGCGSGLISLMLAQRFSMARITAVDIDDGAVIQSDVNFKNSPWAGRLHVLKADIRNWRPEQNFDLIVCNPPYFVDSLKAPDLRRNTARHTDTMPHEALLSLAEYCLEPDGELAIILPQGEMEKLLGTAFRYGLTPASKISLFTSEKAPNPKRILASLKRLTHTESNGCRIHELVIGSPQYNEYVKDFYL